MQDCDGERPLQSSQVGRKYNAYLQMQNVTSGNIHLDIGFCYVAQLLAGVNSGVLDPAWLHAPDPVHQPHEVA